MPPSERFALVRKCRLPLPTKGSFVQGFGPLKVNGAVVATAEPAVAPVAVTSALVPSTNARIAHKHHSRRSNEATLPPPQSSPRTSSPDLSSYPVWRAFTPNPHTRVPLPALTPDSPDLLIEIPQGLAALVRS